MANPIRSEEKKEYNLITVLGPTATGKTRLGAFLASKLNGEIISADSRQVYKFMNIGTGKDLNDYFVDDIRVPYHLIDIVDLSEEYNLFRFKNDFYNSFNDIIQKGKLPFLVGGTGLYLSVVLQNYELHKADFPPERISELETKSDVQLREKLLKLKPKQHNITDLKDRERIITAILIQESGKNPNEDMKTSISSLNIGIKPGRDEIKKRITTRLKKRLDEGMIEEVKKLLNRGITYEKLFFFGLEYKLVSQYVEGKLNYNDMYQKLNSAIHKFAKRQMTWFRKMEREGVIITWFDGSDYNQILNFIRVKLENNGTYSS
jgi:tRNA dimethylallyltransferase